MGNTSMQLGRPVALGQSRVSGISRHLPTLRGFLRLRRVQALCALEACRVPAQDSDAILDVSLRSEKHPETKVQRGCRAPGDAKEPPR